MRPSVHLFIPIYFDVKAFRLLRAEVLQQIPSPWQAIFHVLDDSAGQDPEIQSLRGLPNLTVVTTPRNLGHQRAIVWGLREFLRENLTNELICTLDADGQDRPEDLPRLLSAYREGALVRAQRTSREESFLFKICYLFFKHSFHLLTGTVVNSGNFALYSAANARALLFHANFNYTYGSSLVALGKDVVLVPCARGPRLEGSSKMSFSRLVGHGLKMFVPFLDRVRKRCAFAFACFTILALVIARIW